MNENNLDLTTGSPLAKIIRFSLPLVGGSIFQQLYNFIDTMIVGRLLGIDALAAVGAYYPLSFLVLFKAAALASAFRWPKASVPMRIVIVASIWGTPSGCVSSSRPF